METRLKQLDQLHSFVEGVEKDLTMILQNLQWDRKHLLLDLPTVTCRYNNNHKLPLEKMESHEKKCFVKLQGYSEDDEFLPEPLDINANTLVKLSTQQIITILNDASRCNTMFKRGNNWESRCSEPWSLERLQATYTSDERRAIHDAVVQAVPSCHDLADLALPSCNTDDRVGKVKSRVEILAELRDMRRRRTKYRQAAKTRNYSDVLRDVIKTQMESYSGTSQFSEQSKESLTTGDNTCLRIDYSNQSCSRDRNHETYITNKDVRGERPISHYKSPTRDTNRYNSTNTYSNSKRIHISGNYAIDRYHSYNQEKSRDRDNYKRTDSTRGKAFGYESRDKNISSSDRRYDHKEYGSNYRTERQIKETQIRNRKRNREFDSSDETEDSRTTDGESRRRKSHRDGRSPSHYNTYRSRVESMHIKKERSESRERPKSERTRTPPDQTSNRHLELPTVIKQERHNSPGVTKTQDCGNSSRPINDTKSASNALIKVEKTESPDSRFSYSRSESESDYTVDKNSERNVTLKEENIYNKDKVIENRPEKSGVYGFTSKGRHFKSRRIVYIERSKIQHRHRDSTKIYTGVNEINSRNSRDYVKNVRHGHHKRRSSSASSSDTAEHGHHDHRKDIYHTRKDNNYSDYRRTGASNRYNKRRSYHDSTRCDVRDTETSYDEKRKRKKYS